MLEQPGSETHKHNFVEICKLHANVNKQRTLLADVDVTPLEELSRSRDISMFCNEKCKQPERLVSSMATTLRM